MFRFKVLFLASLSVFFVNIFSLTSFAQGDEYYAEFIEQFTVDIQVNEDGTVDVVEKILYDFGNNERHGILRDIPLVYGEGADAVEIDLYLEKVTDNRGNLYQYFENEYYYYDEVKIGDPDETISGRHWYYIYYSVDDVINPFEDYAELYWNVTGNYWEVPILDAKAVLRVPSGGDIASKQATCYTGEMGEAGDACISKVLSDNSYVFNITDTLSSGEGFTVVAGFEKELVDLPGVLKIDSWPWGASVLLNEGWTEYFTPYNKRINPGDYSVEISREDYYSYETDISIAAGEIVYIDVQLERTKWSIFRDWYLPIFIFVGGFLFFFFYWWFFGKDPEGRGTIMPFYTPPEDLSPGDMGVIVDEKAHLHDITATIINFAVKGYIKIKKSDDGKYSFVRLKELEDIEGLADFEKKIFGAIFRSKKIKEVNLAGLNNNFYAYLPGIKKSLYKRSVEEKYFRMNPDIVRRVYLGISISVFIVLFVVGAVYWSKFTWLYFLCIPLIGVSFIVFSFFMPKKTVKGVRLYEKVVGFKRFLKATSTDRLKVLFSPKDYKGIFEKYLPYAMVFGVEEKWAKQFEGLYDVAPDWYDPKKKENLITFVSSIRAMGSYAERAYTSAPKPVYSSSSSSRSSGGSWKSSGWGSSSSFSSGSSSSSWSGGSGFSSGGSGGGFGGGGGSSW